MAYRVLRRGLASSPRDGSGTPAGHETMD